MFFYTNSYTKSYEDKLQRVILRVLRDRQRFLRQSTGFCQSTSFDCHRQKNWRKKRKHLHCVFGCFLVLVSGERSNKTVVCFLSFIYSLSLCYLSLSLFVLSLSLFAGKSVADVSFFFLSSWIEWIEAARRGSIFRAFPFALALSPKSKKSR